MHFLTLLHGAVSNANEDSVHSKPQQRIMLQRYTHDHLLRSAWYSCVNIWRVPIRVQHVLPLSSASSPLSKDLETNYGNAYDAAKSDL